MAARQEVVVLASRDDKSKATVNLHGEPLLIGQSLSMDDLHTRKHMVLTTW